MACRSSSTSPAASSAAVTASIGVADAGASASALLHLAGEHDLALVGEVAVERPLGQPGALRDLRHRRLVEAAIAVELEGRLSKAAACVGLPAGHVPDCSDGSDCHQMLCYDSD
jgi:hypothetical protein